MKERERTSRSTGCGKRRDDWKVVFLPRQIELELVGIIGPGAGLPESEAMESVFIDGDDCLLALVESLREGSYAAPSFAPLWSTGALSLRDRAVH